jgi:acetylornithine deacetylase/succinyl-diaminopimelate desuccinylase-like protein
LQEASGFRAREDRVKIDGMETQIDGMEIDDGLTAQTTELLQVMIRNQCVNDGTVESGDEIRNSDLLETFLEGTGLDIEHYDAAPDRRSVVARIEGSDPDAPSLCLMGHTDVVPVNPEGWTRDPFSGDLIEGEIWGRGAIDMLCLTSSMAVAFKHLAMTGFKPKGDLIYFGVADEEAGGRWGAHWMVEHARDAIACDYVLTESGGVTSHTGDGPALTLTVAEKGLGWLGLRVHGTPAHGSMPYGTDNALVKAAEVVRRIAEYRPTPQIHDLWRTQVANLPYDDDTKAALLDPRRLDEALASLPDQTKARQLHACSHTTLSPNVVRGGQKTNIIPDQIDIEVDIRTLPGETPADVRTHLRNALGDMYDRLDVEPIHEDLATMSPIDTPLYEIVSDILRKARPGAVIQPSITPGGTDARFFRQIGATAYGAGLFSPAVTYELFAERFHGHDERVDVDSLALNTQLWIEVSRALSG